MKNHKVPKPQTMWAFYNYGHLRGTAPTRRDAIEAVEAHVRSTWEEASEYMQVREVTVTPVDEETP